MSLPVLWSPQTRAVVQESRRRCYVALVGRPPPQPPRVGRLAAPPRAPHLAPSLTHNAPCQREHMWRWRWQLFKKIILERENVKKR